MQEEMKTIEAMFDDLERDTQAKTDQLQALEAENEELSRRLAAAQTASSNSRTAGGGGASDEEFEELQRTLEEKQREADEYALRYAEMIQSTQSYEKKVKNLESRLKRAQRQLEAEKEKAAKSSVSAAPAVECEEPKRSINAPSSSSSSSSSSSLSTAKRPRDVAEQVSSSTATKEEPMAATSSLQQAKRLRFTADDEVPRPRPGLMASNHVQQQQQHSKESGVKRKELFGGDDGYAEDKENMPNSAASAGLRSKNVVASSSSAKSVASKKSRKSISQTAAGGRPDAEGDCGVQ
jgi:hypothetical protein